MATNDVPGANPVNRDNLHAGCWAESANGDGSYVEVRGFENGRVVYEVFDTSKNPIVVYTDAMPEVQFKRQFSWDEKNPASIKWTWHDKSSLPWDVLIQKGLQPGSRALFGRDAIAGASDIADSMARISGDDPDDTAARRVARDLGLRGRNLTQGDLGRWRRALSHVRDGIQAAMDELGA